MYSFAAQVPRGKVTTYGAMARAIGAPRAGRAVGNALNKNPHAPEIACHRVVHSDGRVGGFAHGTRRKERLLKLEGVEIENGKVDLTKFGWGAGAEVSVERCA